MKLKLLLIALFTFSATVSLGMIYAAFLLVHHYIGPEHRQSGVTPEACLRQSNLL
jgi:hypothetical protein